MPYARALAPMPILLVSLLLAAEAAAKPVARVGETVIEEAEFAARVSRQIATTSYHRQTPETAQTAARTVLEEMLEERLLELEAEQRGIRPDPARIEARFDEEAARFGGRERLTIKLEKQGRNVQGFRAHLAAQLRTQQLLESLAATARGRVTEQTARAQYDRQRERYVMPEAYEVDAVLVKLDPRAVTLPGHREEVAGRARAVAEALAAGHTLADVKAAFPSVEAQALGWVHGGSMVPELERAVAGLSPGGVSAPTPVTKGFYVARLLKKRAPAPLAFDTVLDAILAEQQKALQAELREEFLVLARKRWPVEILIPDLSPPR